MDNLNSIRIAGKDVLPLIEGGKGISISNGISSGAWAREGGIGTFSGVNADTLNQDDSIVKQVYKGNTRQERHEELIDYAIKGGIKQAQIAHETSNGEGLININILWEMGGAERVLNGVMQKCQDLIQGVTCGAGMPYRLGEIAAKHNINYYPIISSARAFRALWKRAYRKFSDLLSGVVYEDPWLAGGHNGLSNSENPEIPEDPYERVVDLRKNMNEAGLKDIPIIMAGGVWWLKEWESWLNNNEVGSICFQFGTRPLLTQESPISNKWKKQLTNLKKGEIILHRFSPTGFYSSAVKNDFLDELIDRSNRQIPFSSEQQGDFDQVFKLSRNKHVFITKKDNMLADNWIKNGITTPVKTPDNTLIFVTPLKAKEIRADQIACMGCLSSCNFSNWSQKNTGTTGRKADPRSFCIQKTLQNIAHEGDTSNELMFSGHNAYRFGKDPWYNNGFIPTVKQLIERIQTGF